jgi:hypothetical protein
MMTLEELVEQVEGFNSLPPRETIQLFTWWLHTQGGRETVDNDALRKCYADLYMIAPNVAMYTGRMTNGTPPDFIKTETGFKLHRVLRQELDVKFGVHMSVVAVSKILADLPAKVPNLAERTFLDETLRCYKVKAHRAAIVMAWNLGYSHLLHWILDDAKRLADFNAAISRRYQKRSGITMTKYDDFEEFKEAEVIEIVNTAGLVNGGIIKILKEKLGKRNTAAHPSTVIIVQSQADDVITDLVNNVVVALT